MICVHHMICGGKWNYMIDIYGWEPRGKNHVLLILCRKNWYILIILCIEYEIWILKDNAIIPARSRKTIYGEIKILAGVFSRRFSCIITVILSLLKYATFSNCSFVRIFFRYLVRMGESFIGTAITCMANENAVTIHRVYGSASEKETLEVWRENSINGQKVYTGNGSGKTYQEVVSSFCWAENNYVFTMSSTFVFWFWFLCSESAGWSEGSYFYVVVNDVEYLRGTLSGIPRKELTLSCNF